MDLQVPGPQPGVRERTPIDVIQESDQPTVRAERGGENAVMEAGNRVKGPLALAHRRELGKRWR